MLETYIKDRLKEKDILLMTHIVLGYPDFEKSYEIVKAMVESGVDLMELQIPFSEPIADGPVILHANQESLASGTKVQDCMDFAQKVCAEFQIPFLFMTYYNVVFKYGVEKFANKMSEIGIKGAIVPDLPPEEGQEYLKYFNEKNLAPIYIFSPTTSGKRMQYLDSFAKGFIYCVARKGVTGADTQFSENFARYISKCRRSTKLPLAIGFGVKSREDIDFLKGKADIAVIGTQTIRIVENDGIDAVGDFIKSLR